MNDEKNNKEQLISKQITADTASSISTASAEGSSPSMRELEVTVSQKAFVLSTCLGEIEALLKRLDLKKDAIGNIDVIQSTELDAIVKKIQASPTIPALFREDRGSLRSIRPDIINAICLLEDLEDNLPGYLEGVSVEIRDLYQ